MTTVYNKDGIEFDIDALATDLNGKMDKDTINASDAGKIQMSGMGMPSNIYVDLPVGASNTEYTAPANGWFVLQVSVENTTASYQSNYLTSYGGRGMMTSYGYASNGGAVVPMLKGQTLNFVYETNTRNQSIRFVYAQGSESEAN